MDTSYNSLVETALDIGANDMLIPWEPISPKTMVSPVPAIPPTAAPVVPPPAGKQAEA